jgi:predicted amidohydrolase YtcJ
MRIAMRFLVFLLLLSAAFSCSTEKRTDADLIITGKIYTAIDENPVVEAVAVTDGKILFAGSRAESEKYKVESTKVIELGTQIMTPGFIDGHAHLLAVGANELNLNLMNVKNYDELVQKVADAVAKAKPGEWIVGRGWHQEKWDKAPANAVKGFPTHQQLSKVSPENPVYLDHASGHAALVNAKAMELAGVSAITKEGLNSSSGQSGEIVKDKLGNPTGMFLELATDIISTKIPALDSVRLAKSIELAFNACVRNGLTGLHDAGAYRSTIDYLYKLKAAGKLPIRLNVMLDGWDRDLVYDWYRRGPDIDTAYRLTVRSIKLYSDGALGSRGAWLLQPYSDRPETSGMPSIAMDSVAKGARDALRYGFQLCTHAIGDRANRQILDEYEKALKDSPGKDHRFRIEHAQHIDPRDIPRFGQLGIIPAMQAIHMSSDRPWAIDRLGQKRIEEGAYMWRALIESGAHVVNGTDAPVEPLDPIACFYASVSRKTLKGLPEGGYEPGQKMNRQEALRSYTIEPAYAEFAEGVKGTVAAGKYADFTIFSQDLMTVPEDKILETQVTMTIVEGRVVYLKK